MEIGLVIFWLAVGICPDWWPFPPFPPRPPGPPDPPWLVLGSALGGLAGGWLQLAAFGLGPDGLTVGTAAATAVGALAGSILVRGGIQAVRGRG